jgi:hypothetical protein
VDVRPPSVALMVKVNTPALAGLPLMTVPDPEEGARVRPGGRLPAVSAKEIEAPAAPALAAAMVAE